MGNNGTSRMTGVWGVSITGRRLAGLLLALALLLAACGGDDGGDAEEETGGEATEEAAEEPAEEAEEPAEEEAEEPEEAAEEDAAAGPEVEVVFGHPFPGEHHLVVDVLQPWMDEVTERTGGTVTFDYQPGGAITAPPDAYTHPAEGVTQMGWALQGYTPGRFPVSQVVELPFLFDSAVAGTEALWDLYEEFPALQEEYGDTHVVALWTHDVGDMFTTQAPVETSADVNGLTLRTPAPMQNNLVEALGGAAEGLPAPELYDALDRGVIDGLMIGHSGVPTFNLQEVLGHVTRGNFFVGTMFLVMNQGTWEELSPEQQAVFEETAGRTLSVALADNMDTVGGAAVDQFEEWGFEIHDLGDAELEEWRAATESVPQQWIDEQAEGVPAQEMYDRVLELAGQG